MHIGQIARLAGAPKIKGAGVDLLKKMGEQVSAGDVLYRVHAEIEADLTFAKDLCAKASAYMIGSADDISHVFVEF
jgi:thymidine phosphorylase